MTIYALSTGPGVSGVAIVRISGPEASKAIKLLTKKDLPTPRIATLRKINNINTSELIDEGIIIWFPGPESYTGEDMAEFHVHGGKAIVLALQNELSKIENFRLAEPGEFTKIAFQNGKINLLKAESISDLIAAETEMQRLQAVKIMEGKSAEKFDDLREKLLKILSFVEAKIDFPEEDLPEDNLKKIKEDSSNVLNEIKKILNEEKGEKPLSDDLIAKMVSKNGVKLARRTVAKYREMLKGPDGKPISPEEFAELIDANYENQKLQELIDNLKPINERMKTLDEAIEK